MSAAVTEPAEKKELRLGQQVRVSWVRDLDQALNQADAVLVAKVEKVPTRDLNQLRQQLGPLSSSFHMVKNSLCRISFRNQGWEGLDAFLTGTCAVTPIRGDAAAAAKLLVQFSKSHEGFVLQGGRIGKDLLKTQELKTLAQLPSRQVLLGQVAAMAQSPIRNFAVVLQAPLRALALAFSAVARKKGQGQETS